MANLEWRQLVRTVFGLMDRKYAGHSNERERARELIVAAAEQGAEWREVEDEAREFLRSQNCTPEHIEKQLRRMNETKYLL